jgi:hypothetical protein
VSAENWTQVVVVLAVASLAFGALAWSPRVRDAFAPVCVVLLAAAAVVASLAPELASGRVATTLLVSVAGALSVAGGGPVTTRVFDVVDRDSTEESTIDRAGAILRGGAWIGALERLAVFAGLSAGFPEGVAVVLALKGVGRYPDLRDDGSGAATERFIIGTFTSVLWAAACAGLVALVQR